METLVNIPERGSYWYSFQHPEKKFQVFEVKYARAGRVRVKRIESYVPKVQMEFSYGGFARDFKPLISK